MRKKKKPYWDMNTQELAEATREFDEEFVFEKATPPPPAELAKLKRAFAKRGRPRNGEGTQTISLTVERSLLRRTDRWAKRLKTSRARAVATALERALAKAGF
jgi:hypothetical protein